MNINSETTKSPLSFSCPGFDTGGNTDGDDGVCVCFFDQEEVGMDRSTYVIGRWIGTLVFKSSDPQRKIGGRKSEII